MRGSAYNMYYIISYRMVRTRIAPSPTGEDLHIGNLHVALLNWTFAKKHEGQFIIRIEDTDQTRLVKGSEEKILKTVKDYGLTYSEGPDIGGSAGPYRQSERLETYQIYVQELIKKGVAYYCFCSKERLDTLRKKQQKEGLIPRYDKHCLHLKDPLKKIEGGEPYVIRMNIPEKAIISFEDVVRGTITFSGKDMDDQVLVKTDGFPTYHLAVVVDDHFMKITHVIRGEEWISSTPKHVFLYDAFGWERPVFAHTPLLRNTDKSKLSKRKNPVWASWYLKHGYLPEAILNYLCLMGWSHPKQKEIFDLAEFISVFDLKDIQPVGPVFDLVKLEWMNGEYIRKSQNSNLKSQIFNFYKGKYSENIIEKTIPIIKERIKKLSDYAPLSEFFFEEPKEYQVDLKSHKKLFKKIHDVMAKIEDWETVSIGEKLQFIAQEEGLRNADFFMWVRVAITGKKISPPLNESMEILGKKESLKRLTAVS